MRRRVLIVPILALTAVLVVRRLRRRRAATAPLAPPPAPPPAAAPPEAGTRFVSVPWTLVDAPADEPGLTIRYRAGEHMELDRVDAQETPTQVFVTVLMRWRPPAGGRLAAAREQEAGVSLSAPLGTRELVHAAVDPEAPADGGEPGGPPLYP